jgi:coenzyme Q-binding protein COQ10
MRRRFSKFYPHSTPRDLFALVDDIESYPSFIPFCLHARILSNDGRFRRVANVFGVGPLRLSFVSEARADPPRELVIEAQDRALRAFHLRWGFAPQGEGCLLSCDLTLDFVQPLPNALVALAGHEFERRVVAAFERRAAARRHEKAVS